MGRDVKIGLVCGLVLLTLLIGYVAMIGGGPKKPEGEEPGDGGGLPPAPVGLPQALGDANEPGPDATPGPVLAHASTPSSEGVVSVIPQYKPIVEPVPSVPSAAEPNRLSLTGIPAPGRADPPSLIATPRPRVGSLVSDVPVVTPSSDATRTYTVMKGDAGFWAVSEKAYGEGKYFYVIARANPDADTNALLPGQKLTIPPLRKGPRPAPIPPVRRVRPDSGETLYTVREGDQGFWAVSKKVYEHGKYYQRIAEANPGIDPRRLRAGQTLIVPPLRTATTAPIRPMRRIVPGVGGTYTVQAGDAGFWGIAQKVYGHGKHKDLIAEANPGIDSGKLKPGQQLVVPPLSTEDERTARLPRVPRPVPAAGPSLDGKPIFD